MSVFPSSAEIVVELAEGDTWDTASPTWTDISADVEGVQIDIGRSPEDPYRWMVGQAQVTVNNRTFGYDKYNAGVATVPSVLNAPIRIRCVRGAETDTLFYGFVKPRTGWRHRDVSAKESYVDIDAHDLFGIIGGYDLPIQETPVGSYETSGDRIDRVLDACGVPSGFRAIDAGEVQIVGATWGVNALTHCQDVALSEGGTAAFYVRKTGVVTFDWKNSMFEPWVLVDGGRKSSSQQDFDNTSPAATDAIYTSMVRADPPSFNIWRADIDGFGYDTLSSSAIANHGPSTYEASLLCASTADVVGWVNNGLSLYASPLPTVDVIEMTVNAMRNAETLDACAELDLRDRINVSARPAGASIDYGGDLQVIGISHAITPGSWTTKFRLASVGWVDSIEASYDFEEANGLSNADGTLDAAL